MISVFALVAALLFVIAFFVALSMSAGWVMLLMLAGLFCLSMAHCSMAMFRGFNKTP